MQRASTPWPTMSATMRIWAWRSASVLGPSQRMSALDSWPPLSAPALTAFQYGWSVLLGTTAIVSLWPAEPDGAVVAVGVWSVFLQPVTRARARSVAQSFRAVMGLLLIEVSGRG